MPLPAFDIYAWSRWWPVLGAYFVYLFVGATIFSSLEEPLELERLHDVQVLRQEFMDKHPDVSESDVDDYMYQLLDIAGFYNRTLTEMNWRFGDSFLYTFSLLATIGYGVVPPRSDASKLFSLLYCLFGIPFTLMLFKAVVAEGLEYTAYLLEVCNTKLGRYFQPMHIRFIHAGIIVTLNGLVVFLMPALIMCLCEPDWSFLDGFYFVFMSVATIGVADVMPGEEIGNVFLKQFYKFFITICMFIGICATLLTVAVVNDIPHVSFLINFLHPKTVQAKMAADGGGGKTGGGGASTNKSATPTTMLTAAATNVASSNSHNNLGSNSAYDLNSYYNHQNNQYGATSYEPTYLAPTTTSAPYRTAAGSGGGRSAPTAAAPIRHVYGQRQQHVDDYDQYHINPWNTATAGASNAPTTTNSSRRTSMASDVSQ